MGTSIKVYLNQWKRKSRRLLFPPVAFQYQLALLTFFVLPFFFALLFFLVLVFFALLAPVVLAGLLVFDTLLVFLPRREAGASAIIS